MSETPLYTGMALLCQSYTGIGMASLCHSGNGVAVPFRRPYTGMACISGWIEPEIAQYPKST